MKFRKKPVTIDAIEWSGGNTKELDQFLGMNWGRADAHGIAWNHPDEEAVVVYNAIEKVWLPCPVGCMIIRGVKGEFYPCDYDIFEQTYEAL